MGSLHDYRPRIGTMNLSLPSNWQLAIGNRQSEGSWKVGLDVIGRVVLRFVTHESLGIANVPESSGVVGYPEENRERHLAAERFHQQLSQVARAAPFTLNVAGLAQQLALV